MAVATKKPVWEPRDTHETNVSRFIHYVNHKHGLQLRTYEDLHQWSTGRHTSHLFWEDAYTWLQLSLNNRDGSVNMLENKNPVSADMFPPPTFFPSQSLNITELMLRDRKDHDIAINFSRESATDIEKVTWAQFRERIRAIRSALVASRVGSGDIVAAVISNSVDAMTICLAALSIGAVWSSSSCDLGVAGIADRFAQIHPKIIFTDSSYMYAGKTIKLADRITQWSHSIGRETDRLAAVVVIPTCAVEVDVTKVHRGLTWSSFLGRDSGAKLEFAPVSFSDPAFVLFSSGTTGKPKCITHSTGGVALKVKSDMTLQHDVRRSDVVFQYTTTSWVMWVLNLLSLSCASSMLLYEGSPFYPGPSILLELAEKTGVSVFGTSPRYLAELKTRSVVPRSMFNLESLRVVTSTGSVLSAEQYDWFYSTGFPKHAQLISMSGGTDIAGCFVGGTPLLPVYAGEIQCKALGMAVEIFDAARIEPVSVENEGEAGELVCTRPFPSQPISFIGADGDKRYRASYFERYGPSIWCQGDFIKRIPDTGGLIMLGRSDGVLNPSGVRFGSAEIYAVTDTFPELADSICVGQKRDIDIDERVLLFVKLHSGVSLDPDLDGRIRSAIRARYSPRHVPKLIFQIDDIPYTVNGKKCEINIKQIVNNRKAAVSGTVANPESLKLYERYKTLPAEGKMSSRNAKL